MKQPRKLKKKPDLKKRLDAVRSAPGPDVSFTVTLPAGVYRAIEAVASAPVSAWVTQMLVDYVEGEFRADVMMQEHSEDG